MAEQPARRVEIRQWQGLVSNRGPFQGRPGSALVQRNCRTLLPGILEPRAGLRPLFFNAPVGYEPPAASSSGTSTTSSPWSSTSTSTAGGSSSVSTDTGCRNTATVTFGVFPDGSAPCCDETLSGVHVLDLVTDTYTPPTLEYCEWQLQAVQDPCGPTVLGYMLSLIATPISIGLLLYLTHNGSSSIHVWRRYAEYSYPFSGSYSLTYDAATSNPDVICQVSVPTCLVAIP